MKLIETLLLLNFCHLLGDFTHLSTNWMLNAKRLGKPLFPILIHAYVHATLFFFAVWFIQDIYMAVIAFAIQAPTHFLIDVLKGRMNGWFPKLQSPTNKWHWVIFGCDQNLHQIVIIFTAYITCLYN